MTTEILIALIGGLVGGLVVRAPELLLAIRKRKRATHLEGMGNDADRRELAAIRDDLWKIGNAVGRVLEDVTDLSLFVRGDLTQPEEKSTGTGRREGGPAGRGMPPGASASTVGGGRGYDTGSQRPELQRPPVGADSSLQLEPNPYRMEPGPLAAPAHPAPRATLPPPNAVVVEVRDDRIVDSSAYPPEAWLEPRGPAVGHLWLNPHVPLTEYALRRLSTYFVWEGKRENAPYDTVTPAEVRWDESQRVGTLGSQGRARAR